MPWQIARRLKLKDLPQCRGLSGGQSVELVATNGNPRAFPLIPVLSGNPNCDFSFSGLQSAYMKIIDQEEEKHGILIDLRWTV